MREICDYEHYVIYYVILLFTYTHTQVYHLIGTYVENYIQKVQLKKKITLRSFTWNNLVILITNLTLYQYTTFRAIALSLDFTAFDNII